MVTSAVLAAILLATAMAQAQSSAAAPEPTARSIIPLTGPSAIPVSPDLGKPEVVPAVAQGEQLTRASGPKVAPKRRVATVTRQGSHAVRAVHKPVAKAAVRKSVPAKHVAKGAGTARPRQVAAAKPRPPRHHVAISRPIPLTKPPAKESVPTQPVLPRV
jgi:hypothetical protein